MMKHVPNILTVIRLFLIPVYLLFFYSNINNSVYWALAVFVFASITDIADGFIARKYNAESKIGQLLDPLADKLMQLTALFTLSFAGYIKMWVFWFFLGKEVLMIISGVVLYLSKTKIIIPSNIFGKLTTILVYIAIVLSVFESLIFDLKISEYLFVIVIIFALITFIQYGYIGIKKLLTYRSKTNEEVKEEI